MRFARHIQVGVLYDLPAKQTQTLQRVGFMVGASSGYGYNFRQIIIESPLERPGLWVCGRLRECIDAGIPLLILEGWSDPEQRYPQTLAVRPELVAAVTIQPVGD